MIMLSATQNEILAYIRQCGVDDTEPCVSDICVGLDLSFATVSRAVRLLHGYGLLTRRRGTHVDAFIYSIAPSENDICAAEPYHVTRCRTAYAQCTGIAINQEPIPPLAWRR